MKELIAKDLLDIQAVFLRPNEPFTWASGIKSPIYCDNRLTLSYPKVRKDVETGLAKLVQENFPEAECLMGTATADRRKSRTRHESCCGRRPDFNGGEFIRMR